MTFVFHSNACVSHYLYNCTHVYIYLHDTCWRNSCKHKQDGDNGHSIFHQSCWVAMMRLSYETPSQADVRPSGRERPSSPSPDRNLRHAWKTAEWNPEGLSMNTKCPPCIINHRVHKCQQCYCISSVIYVLSVKKKNLPVELWWSHRGLSFLSVLVVHLGNSSNLVGHIWK